MFSSICLVILLVSLILFSLSIYSSALKSTPSKSILESPQTSITKSNSTLLLSSLSLFTLCGLLTSSFLLKSYLTIHDLYMKYAPLKSLTKPTSQVLLPRVLPRITLKDLYLKFSTKKQLIKQAAPHKELTKTVTAPLSPQPPQLIAPSPLL